MISGKNNQQTKMAAALTKAVLVAPKGGRVGHRVLTNNAKHGLNGTPAQRKAVSAGSVTHG